MTDGSRRRHFHRLAAAGVVLVAAVAAQGCGDRDKAALALSGAAGGPSATGSCDVTVATKAELAAQNTTSNGLVRRICVAAGTYHLGGSLAWRRADTVLRGIPDAQGDLPLLRGQLSVEADNVTVSKLAISYGNYGAPEAGQADWRHQPASLRLWADHLSLLDSVVRNPKSTCVEVGYADAYDSRYQVTEPPDSIGSIYSDNGGPAFHKVFDVVVEGNRVGGCADDPWFLGQWTCNNSGYPAIYSQWVDGLEVSENVIRDSAIRGIQLFPANSNVTIRNNLLRRNSIAMNIGTEDVPWTRANGIAVSGNVFDHQTSQELADTYSNLGAGCVNNKYLLYNSPPGVTVDDQATEHKSVTTVDPSVALDGNCGTDVRPRPGYATDFAWTNNSNATAKFVSSTDDSQTADSPCAAAGPVSLRPGGALAVSGSGDGAKSAGDIARHTYVITNPTATLQTVDVTATLPVTGTAYARVEGPGCSGTICTTSVGAGASATVEIVLAAKQGGLTLTSGLEATSAGLTSASATASTSVSGSFCTRSGTAGADTITAPVQQGTVLCGFEGDDVLVPGHGGDQIRGGLGSDTVDFGSAAADAEVANRGWSVKLGANPASASMIPPDPVNADLLYSIESLIGTANGDAFTGDGGANHLSGGSGDDSLQGAGGDDTILGGTGVDTASYGLASTAITARLTLTAPQNTGGAGTDTLDASLENLVGGAGADTLIGDAGANRLSGGLGDDTLQGTGGNDTVIGGDGVDTVSYSLATSSVTASLANTAAQATGGAGTDTLDSSLENLVGGAAADKLIGDYGGNKITGLAGNDWLYGSAGNDWLLGGAGNDAFTGGSGTDRCDQGSGTGTKTTCES